MLNLLADIAAFEPIQDLVWKLLLSLAFIYLATRVPSLLGNAGTFDAWMHTLYFGMSLPGSMVRSARTIGLLGRTAMGAGRAAGAASSTALAAGGAVRSAADTGTPAEGAGLPRSASE